MHIQERGYLQVFYITLCMYTHCVHRSPRNACWWTDNMVVARAGMCNPVPMLQALIWLGGACWPHRQVSALCWANFGTDTCRCVEVPGGKSPTPIGCRSTYFAGCVVANLLQIQVIKSTVSLDFLEKLQCIFLQSIHQILN